MRERTAVLRAHLGLGISTLHPAGFPASLASRAVSIPVWGCGDIRSIQDAHRCLAAAAKGIRVGTAASEDPWRAIRVARALGEEQ